MAFMACSRVSFTYTFALYIAKDFTVNKLGLCMCKMQC